MNFVEFENDLGHMRPLTIYEHDIIPPLVSFPQKVTYNTGIC